jgi:hypothetical protein
VTATGSVTATAPFPALPAAREDVGRPPAVLAEVTPAAHDAGMEVMLEGVYTRLADELRSLRAAPDTGVDWMLGGTHAGEEVAILAGTDGRYCPFPSSVERHPRVLKGGAEAIAGDAPAIAAGSVGTLEPRVDLDAAGTWGFMIGGATFEQRLPAGPTVAGRIAAVLEAARGVAVGR